MGSLSGEEYYYKIDNMVLTSCQLLRKVFQTRWKNTTGNDWEHAEEQGQTFMKSEEGKKVKAILQSSFSQFKQSTSNKVFGFL